jgi:hypothetical protein
MPPSGFAAHERNLLTALSYKTQSDDIKRWGLQEVIRL